MTTTDRLTALEQTVTHLTEVIDRLKRAVAEHDVKLETHWSSQTNCPSCGRAIPTGRTNCQLCGAKL